MTNQNCDMVYICKVVPEFLQEDTTDWFSELPQNNIFLFRDFDDALFNGFFQRSKVPWATVDILNIK